MLTRLAITINVTTITYYLNKNPGYREYLVVYKFSTLNLKKTKFFQLKPIDKT